ncbi:hypothetical protein M569_16844, partial [Genlisea aurea]
LLSLLEVSSMPMLELLLICFLGALLATDHIKLLSADTRKSLNKIVFAVFTPSLLFASLLKTVRIEDIISWWFMPVNIAITFIVGGSFGWIAMKIIRPKPYIQNVIIAMCASGNLGNILLIIIPSICKEKGSPFGDRDVCSTVGLSYASFSMALGAFFIWTFGYYLIRRAGEKYNEMIAEEREKEDAYDALEGNERTPLLSDAAQVDFGTTAIYFHLLPIHLISLAADISDFRRKGTFVKSIETAKHLLMGALHQIVEELESPPILAAILGFIFGSVSWLRHLLLGDNAPLRVINDCIKLLGDGTIPCITLIMGGNLIEGLRKANVTVGMVLSIVLVRYVILPIIGIGVVTGASHLGILPSDPLFSFILMLQFTLPPATNIIDFSGTMAQLYGVAEEESSVLFLWTYLVAAFAMTGWSALFMWLLY